MAKARALRLGEGVCGVAHAMRASASPVPRGRAAKPRRIRSPTGGEVAKSGGTPPALRVSRSASWRAGFATPGRRACADERSPTAASGRGTSVAQLAWRRRRHAWRGPSPPFARSANLEGTAGAHEREARGAPARGGRKATKAPARCSAWSSRGRSRAESWSRVAEEPGRSPQLPEDELRQRHVVVEQIAHRVHEDRLRRAPPKRELQYLRLQGEVEPVLVVRLPRRLQPLRPPLGAAVLAARADLRAARHRIPRRLGPLDRGPLRHQAGTPPNLCHVAQSQQV